MLATMTRPAAKQPPSAIRKPRIACRTATVNDVAVTLPASVLDRLKHEARGSGVPTEWMVAAFVAALAD